MTTPRKPSPRERTLLRQAKRVADNGKMTAASQLYQEFLAEFPDSTDGLLGYARVVKDAAAQEQLLNAVFDLDPDNAIAKAALRGESLEQLLNPPVIQAESAEEPTTTDTKHVASTSQADNTDEAESEPVGGLRCNRCGKPIDMKNSIHTAVGYRCKECVREIESSYFTATNTQQAIAFLVALPLATIAAFVFGRFIGGIGFFSLMITFFAAPAVGGTIGSIAYRAAGKNRGRHMPRLLSIAIWAGASIALLLTGSLITLAIFAFTASGAAYFRVK